jgi:hypothetical protein
VTIHIECSISAICCLMLEAAQKLLYSHVAVNRGHMHLTDAKVWPCHTIGCMHFRDTRSVKCLAALTPSILLLLSLTYSPFHVDITGTQLTMAEQVSFTRFLWCACHDSGEGSAFFGTHRAAELHISRSAGCKTACKGVKSIPVL